MFIVVLLIIFKIWGNNSWWISKQTAAQSYCGIVHSNKKEWTIDVLNNPDDSQKYNEWKRPMPKGHTLYDTIYIIFLKL